MNSYLKITITTFTIWILCAGLNSLLCSTYLCFADDHLNEWFILIFSIFILSLFCSAPGFFIFWIVLIINFQKWIGERALFRVAISTGFILALVTGIIASQLFKNEFPTGQYIIAGFVILSAITSILMHFNHFKK